jgi:TrmH family RNA methyltransferase
LKQISSIQNPFIKNLVLLKRQIANRGTFLIEGQREIMYAKKGGYEIETILL